ncbi:MAG: DUF1499 domain-containing protein [Pseudomonadota bacterium]
MAIAVENDAPQRRHWSIWLARTSLILGILTVGGALLGAIGAGERWWSLDVGLQALTGTFFLGLITLILALLILVYYRRKGGRIVLVTVLAFILSGGYVGYIGYHIAKASSLPMIHDISTDLENPPQYVTLSLRQDNYADIPGRGDSEYAGMDAFERWQVMHREGYPDIETLRFDKPVVEVIEAAEEIAISNQWEVASVDTENGRLEATDTVALLKFKDDVVVRAIPDANGEGSIVDIRSVSRFGLSDIGVNAKRIRKFSAQLKEKLSN